MTETFLFLDLETYYDSEYSLRKLLTPNYILDSRFETIGCAASIDNGSHFWVDGPDFGPFIRKFNPKTTATVTFNAMFDNSILAWRYNFVPFRMYDSMFMAKTLRGHILPPRANLHNVADRLELGHKGDTIAKVSGMHAADIKAAGLWYDYIQYAMNDNVLNKAIFLLLVKELPTHEQVLMDLVLRCTIEPTFRLDRALLETYQKHLRDVKLKLLKDADLLDHQVTELDDAAFKVLRKHFTSNPRFAAALEARGVAIQYKVSPTIGADVPAFAKTDEFMSELQEHPDPKVQALACARIGLKSTLEESRCASFTSIADLVWPNYCSGNMPIPLVYGPHTHRLAGGWKLNPQNMPRGGQLRRALIAPPGHKVIAGDLSQIEARLVCWLAGCFRLLDRFRAYDQKLGRDPYSLFASDVFGFDVDPKKHPIERFIGKAAVLGLGYQCGVDKFENMVITMARTMKISLGSAFGHGTAVRTVMAFRANVEFPNLWRLCDTAVREVLAWPKAQIRMRIGPMYVSPGQVMGPNGLALRYHNMYCDMPTQEYFYTYGGFRHKIYGAALLENIVQYLARIILMNAGLRLYWQGLRFIAQTHDELAFIVRDDEVDNAIKLIHEELTRPPSWGKDIPLNADVKAGQSYGEAK